MTAKTLEVEIGSQTGSFIGLSMGIFVPCNGEHCRRLVEFIPDNHCMGKVYCPEDRVFYCQED